MPDATVNGAHARHYIAQSAGQHGAIVRLQEERDTLRARIAELEWLLSVEQTCNYQRQLEA